MFRSVLVASVAIVMLALAGPAAAVPFTSSQITAPTDNSVVTLDRDNPNTMHVTGTTSGGAANADLVCYYGSSKKTVATNITVAANAFSVDVPLDNATKALMRSGPQPARDRTDPSYQRPLRTRLHNSGSIASASRST